MPIKHCDAACSRERTQSGPEEGLPFGAQPRRQAKQSTIAQWEMRIFLEDGHCYFVLLRNLTPTPGFRLSCRELCLLDTDDLGGRC